MSDLGSKPEWLERANRLATIATLLSTTVHEVNNALQVISGSAEMLGVSNALDAVTRRGEAIGAHARRASALLAELSAFARDETTAAQRLELGQVGQRALAMRQYSLARLKLECTFQGSGDTSTVVMASPRAVLQITLNLIVNAERALVGHSGALVTVGVERRAGRADLTVRDNGPGIPRESVGRLFEAGAHASGTNLGIGLAVAKLLAERDGGELRYEPQPAGAMFRLSYPAAP
jgi:C4-dicarboxylate-specific signal transduction histidine kinase